MDYLKTETKLEHIRASCALRVCLREKERIREKELQIFIEFNFELLMWNLDKINSIPLQKERTKEKNEPSAVHVNTCRMNRNRFCWKIDAEAQISQQKTTKVKHHPFDLGSLSLRYMQLVANSSEFTFKQFNFKQAQQTKGKKKTYKSNFSVNAESSVLHIQIKALWLVDWAREKKRIDQLWLIKRVDEKNLKIIIMNCTNELQRHELIDWYIAWFEIRKLLLSTPRNADIQIHLIQNHIKQI